MDHGPKNTERRATNCPHCRQLMIGGAIRSHVCRKAPGGLRKLTAQEIKGASTRRVAGRERK